MSQKVRLGLAAIFGTVALTSFLVPSGAEASNEAHASVAAAAAASATNPISLTGEGSDDLAKEIPAWSNDLYGSTGDLSLAYTVVGGLEGRLDYINGIGNFVVSAVPWQPSELAQLPASAGGLIAAPIEVSAVGFGLAWGPQYTLNRSCAANDRSCKPSTKYTGTLDIPSTSLTDILWRAIAKNQPATCGCLSDPAILATTAGQLPQGRDTAPPTLSVGPVPPAVALLRSDPSETSYYMQDFAQTAAPAEFAKTPFFKPPISEYLQGEENGGFTQTQQGVEAEVDYMTNEGGAVVADNPEGIITPLPPSGPTGAKYYLPPGLKFNGTPAAYPPAWIGVENASGQWVTPNPSTIDAAVDAGGAKPLYALSSRVPGPTPAYPLTYVDSLYVPAHGLTADQAEAIATVIRYGVTAGQDAMPPQNDGQLPPSLVQQALAAANQLIASNCTTAAEEVVVSDAIGRYAPLLGPLDGKSAVQRQAELAAIGPMLHCVAAPTPTTPTTPPPTTSTTTAPHVTSTTSTALPASSGSSTSGTSSGSTGSTGQTGGSTRALATVSPTSNSPQPKTNSPRVKTNSPPGGSPSSGVTGPVTLLNLPLPLPWSGSNGYDRLVGMILGGLAFLLLWRSRGALGGLFRP